MDQRKFTIEGGPTKWEFIIQLFAGEESMQRLDVRMATFDLGGGFGKVALAISGGDRIEPKDPPYGVAYAFRAVNKFGKTAHGEYNTSTGKGWIEYDEPTAKKEGV